MKIFRKRYIPNEIVDISGDEVVFQDENLIVTKWLPIKPRTDFSKGVSYTMLDKGWKISRFYDENNQLVYWYCDIIDYRLEEVNGEAVYTIIDLLVDVKVYDDGTYEILDMDELEEALRANLITAQQKDMALDKLNSLIELIKENKFPPKICFEKNE